MIICKRRISPLLFLLLALACAKDYSYERRPAAGFLVRDTGTCQPIQVTGNYSVATNFTGENYIVVQVHFTKAGAYDIRTGVQNGFSFRDSSIIKDTGVFSIKLSAVGIPLAAGTTGFTLRFDTSYCSFSVSVQHDVPAQYSLIGTPASCTDAFVHGDYTRATPLTLENKVSLQVDVTAIGNYSIHTGVVNGIAFNAEGNFTSTGIQTIMLEATGIPTMTGFNIIPVTAGSSNCSFVVTVKSNIDPALVNQSDSAWQFNQGSRTFKGFLDGANTHMLHDTTVLTLVGLTPLQDLAIAIVVYFPASAVIKTGEFQAPGAASFLFFDHVGNTIFTSGTTTSNNPGCKIVITNYDTATNIVSGSFSGFVLDNQNQRVPITAGRFAAKVN